jgi:hypothetical protein
MARPGLEPGTPRFSGTGAQSPEGGDLRALRKTRYGLDAGGFLRFPVGLGHERGPGGLNVGGLPLWATRVDDLLGAIHPLGSAQTCVFAGDLSTSEEPCQRPDCCGYPRSLVVSGTLGDECLNASRKCVTQGGRGRPHPLQRAGASRPADRTPAARPSRACGVREPTCPLVARSGRARNIPAGDALTRWRFTGASRSTCYVPRSRDLSGVSRLTRR